MWEASLTPIDRGATPAAPIVKGRSAELRRGRVSEDYACYAISKSVNRRAPVLAADNPAKILINSWQYLRSRHRIKPFASCIMPDHSHLVLCLMPGESLSQLMEDSNKFTARDLNKLLKRRGQFWQNGFYDHRCRNDKELYDQCLYNEHNPVRRGLVITAETWPYSSAFAANKWLLDREWWP
ncbi:MAG: transposase [Pirellulales bacterium]